MAFKLTWSATLQETDDKFNANGQTFAYGGSELYGGPNLHNGDVEAMAKNIGDTLANDLRDTLAQQYADRTDGAD